ncbi:MAG: mechanosensitive ion channel [Gemmatimonadota bacterium]|nr:mechanosensitive ion channel [Gemmatimonadota bacterium]
MIAATGTLAALQTWSRVLFRIGGNDVTLAHLVMASAIFLASLIFARLVGSILNRIITRRTEGIARGSVRSTIRLIQYGIMLIGFLAALQTLGVELAALFAAGALFAVALGFAMQNVVGNFISGILLLLERSIKPGDIIEIDGQIAEVKEMGIRAAIARTLNEEDLIIPSSILVQSTVRNFTLRDALSRLRVVVGVVYSSDMALVRETLEEAAAALEWRERTHDPVVLMKAFGASSVDFEVSVWIDDPWQRTRRMSDLHEAIWWALRDAGVTIAFPQMDVHFDDAALAAWRGRAGEPGAQ